MSSRQFKSMASSSRAASGGGGFGAFGSASTGSVLSYLTPPPSLTHISDSNVVVAFKSLSKKDATTKTKALEDLRAFVQSPPPEQGGVETAIVDAWVSQLIFYQIPLPQLY
jgi:E3 ubiquitin-protein ligase listerin